MKPTVTAVGVLALALALASPCAGAEQAPAAPEPLTKEQLDQLVAPIALYPDPLLSQVLIASTYPLEIVEADRWRRKNADLKGDALDKALAEKDWDPSVEGLTHFADLLKRLSENLDWTKDLGDAFLAQQADLMDAVQRMRRQAEEAGTLKTTKEQTVIKEKEIVRIEPADPQVVYVPSYPPTAYGPTYAPPPSYYPGVWGYPAGGMLMSFGMGMATGALIGGAFDWDDHDCYVNNYYGGGGGGKGNTNVNINKNVDRSRTNIGGGDRQKWEHRPEHRRNVGYRDQRTAQKFEGRDKVAARDRQQRDAARGYDRGGGGSQPGAGGGGRPATGAVNRPGGGDRPAATRPRADTAGRPGDAGRGGGQARTGGGRQGAFQGYGNAGSTRQASSRGASSRSGRSYAGGSGFGGGGGRGGGTGGGGGRHGGGGGGRRR